MCETLCRSLEAMRRSRETTRQLQQAMRRSRQVMRQSQEVMRRVQEARRKAEILTRPLASPDFAEKDIKRSRLAMDLIRILSGADYSCHLAQPWLQ